MLELRRFRKDTPNAAHRHQAIALIKSLEAASRAVLDARRSTAIDFAPKHQVKAQLFLEQAGLANPLHKLCGQLERRAEVREKTLLQGRTDAGTSDTDIVAEKGNQDEDNDDEDDEDEDEDDDDDDDEDSNEDSDSSEDSSDDSGSGDQQQISKKQKSKKSAPKRNSSKQSVPESKKRRRDPLAANEDVLAEFDMANFGIDDDDSD